MVSVLIYFFKRDFFSQYMFVGLKDFKFQQACEYMIVFMIL